MPIEDFYPRALCPSLYDGSRPPRRRTLYTAAGDFRETGHFSEISGADRLPFQKNGFLKSTRGASGGYRLARPARDYTAGDILRITEGPLAPVACLETEANDCPRKDACGTLSFWTGLYQVINDYVDSVTLADLCERQKEFGPDFCI